MFGVYRYRLRSNWLDKVAFTLTATLVQVFKGSDWMLQGEVGRVRWVPKVFTSKENWRQCIFWVEGSRVAVKKRRSKALRRLKDCWIWIRSSCLMTQNQKVKEDGRD